MSSLLVFVFSLLTLYSGAYVSASIGNSAMPTTQSSATCPANCYDNQYQFGRPCAGYHCAYTRIAYSRDCSAKCDGVYGKPDYLNFQETQALLSFIKKVLPNSGSLNWNESEPACSWEGVTCSPGGTTVLYLRLPQKNLTGEIPSDTIGNLTSLRVLSLDHNTLTGEIPSDFSKLNFLTTLYLDHNNFSGNIPSSFSTLSYLTTFDVSYNKLVGQIPPSLSKFPADAFSNNSNLCGSPLPSCSNSSSPPPPDGEGDHTSTPKGRAIFGIFSGSTMMLLIFLGSVGKNIYQYIRLTSENKKLVKFWDDAFDLEDLLKTTVEDLSKKLVKFAGGSVGMSCKQVFVGENKTAVLKILKDVVVTEEEFNAKMDVLGTIKNRYVVPLRAYYNYSSDEKWLVYDYMPAGSLSARLHGSKASRQIQLDWDQRMRIAMSAARGLAYLHEDKTGGEGEKSVVHGNINSSTVLIRQETNIEASVSDYGLNTLFDASSSQDHHVTGYWAPEVNDTQEFTLKSDVYSFGVLLLELLTGKTPKQASLGSEGVHFSMLLESVALEEPKDEIFDVELRMVPNNVKEIMKEFLEIAKDCVSKVPEQRPIMQVVVSKMEEIWLRQSSDDHSKGFEYTPSTKTQDTLSTITLDTPSTITP